MSTGTLNQPEQQSLPTMEDAIPEPDFGEKLKQQTAAVRIRVTRFCPRRALTTTQRDQAASPFGAEGEMLGATKKLVNTSSAVYKAVTGKITQATAYWKLMTVPFPEDGIRLINKSKIEDFTTQMNAFQAELDEAIVELNDHYAELRLEAQQRLGTLFNESDYPASIGELFTLSFEFPSVDPPDYLKDLNPALYEAEQKRIAQRFESAVEMAEEAFTAELADMVSRLCDSLAGEVDGKKKSIRSNSLEKVEEFVERFKSMSVGSNSELEKLAEMAQQAVGGVDVKELRKDGNLKSHLAVKLGEVNETLQGMMESKAKRAVSFDDDE